MRHWRHNCALGGGSDLQQPGREAEHAEGAETDGEALQPEHPQLPAGVLRLVGRVVSDDPHGEDRS